VCGRRDAEEPDLARPAAAARSFEPWAAPERGPWFEFRRGPLSISCCSIDGSRGTGSGLRLRIGF
jgi:hypothetical protein